MVIVKENGRNEICLIKDGYTYDSEWYSLMVQNTLTKDITTYNVKNVGNEFYFKFNIDFDLENGEYYMLLFENPDKLPFYADTNAPKNIDYIRYLVNENQAIMSGEFFLVFGTSDKLGEINFIKSELLRIGEYKSKTIEYKKEQKYVQYNG